VDKTMHFTWPGGTLPSDGADTVFTWHVRNPAFGIVVWIIAGPPADAARVTFGAHPPIQVALLPAVQVGLAPAVLTSAAAALTRSGPASPGSSPAPAPLAGLLLPAVRLTIEPTTFETNAAAPGVVWTQPPPVILAAASSRA
jgi:hypothetical protein